MALTAESAPSDRPRSFRLGEWLVSPPECSLSGSAGVRVVEPKIMDVLVALCAHGGEVVSTEELLRECWRGVFYGDNPVHKAIAHLRRALDDSAVAPRYVATVRKRGYRIVAPIVYPETLPAAPQRWVDGSPYVGLAPFDGAHAGVFFGRERLSARILRRLAMLHRRGRGCVLLLGASGCGKTSLLRAALVPALLRAGGFEGCEAAASADFALADDGGDLIDGLVATMLAWTVAGEALFHPGEREHLVAGLRSAPESVATLIDERLRRRLGERRRPALLIVLDRLERLLAREEAVVSLQRLFDVLRALLAGGRVIALVACRNDFYPQLVAIEGMDAMKQVGSFDIAPLGAGELVQSIREPARAAGLRFEVDPASLMRLDDVLRDDAVRAPQSLPLLQHALLEIHRRCGDGGMMTFAAYRDIGGLDGALARHAESVYAALPDIVRERLPLVLGELVAHVGDNDALIGRQAAWTDLDPAAVVLARAFVEQRLFVAEFAAGTATFGVAHEALFRAWPRASAWVAENRRLLRTRARVHRAALRWYQEGRRVDFLLPGGSQLDDACGLLAASRHALARRDILFIFASRRRHRRQRMLRRVLIAGVLASCAAAGVAGVFATIARGEADRRRVQAETLVGFMLGELTDKLQPLGRLDVLDSTASEAMRYLSSQVDDNETGVALLRIRAFQRIGQIRFARGQNDDAGTAFAQALALSERLVAKGDDVDALFELGNSAFWHGQVAYRAMALEEARVDWSRYLDTARRLVALRPDLPRGRLELSYALNNLATLDYRKGEAESAKRLFEESLALKQSMLANAPQDMQLLVDTADTLSWLGSAASSTGDLMRARDRQSEALSMIRSARAARPNDAQLRYREAISAMQAARVYLAVGNLERATDHANDAFEALRLLAASDAQNLGRQRDLAFAGLQLGWLRVLAGNEARGCALVNDSVRITNAFGERAQFPAEWTRLLVSAHTQSARCALRKNDMAQARADIERARAPWSRLADDAASDLPSAGALAQYAIADAVIAQRESNATRVATAAQRALVIARGPPARDREPLLVELQVRALLLLDRPAEAAPLIERLKRSEYKDPEFMDFMRRQYPQGENAWQVLMSS